MPSRTDRGVSTRGDCSKYLVGKASGAIYILHPTFGLKTAILALQLLVDGMTCLWDSVGGLIRLRVFGSNWITAYWFCLGSVGVSSLNTREATSVPNVVKISDHNVQSIPNSNLYKLGANSGNLFEDGADMAMNTSDRVVTISTPGMDDTLNNTKVGPIWFATLLKGDTSRKSINFRTLVTTASNGTDVVISKELVSFVNERVRNTLYGFFLGKRVPYIVVENYIKNTWRKFCLLKSIMTKEDGLIPIATKLGKPLMLEFYRTTMCTNSWGKASYARAMVELREDVELKDTILVIVPKFVGVGYTMRTIRVEYKWTHPGYDDGKPLNKVDSDPVNPDSKSDVKVAYDETAQFMASGGANDASLYENKDYDIYDSYEIEGLTIQELPLCDMMDIDLRGRSRRYFKFGVLMSQM
ncbi:hypothetical protein Tco_0290454 [Tanacetum coccineum]